MKWTWGTGVALAAGLGLCASCRTVVTSEGPALSEFEVETSVDEHSARQVVLPARPSRPVFDPVAAQDPEQETESEREVRLRERFGSTILIRPDGRITKQYFFSAEAGGVLRKLLTGPGKPEPPKHQGFEVGGPQASQSMLGRMLGGHRVEFLYIENFETPEGVPIVPRMTATALQPEASKAPNDLVLVTAEPSGVEAFEGALDLFYANIPQVEIEVKVVEYSTTDGLAIGVDQVDAGAPAPGPVTPSLDNLSSGKLVENIINRFPLNPPLVGSATIGDRGIISLGGIHDSWQLAAQLQLLETRGVVDVLSSPKMMVRNGGTASIATHTDLPFPQAAISSSGQNITANIVFKPVGITLNIRPVIAGTQTVILQIYANVAAVTSFAATEPVATPIISSREVLTSVHVGDGRTTVIGGLVSTSTLTTETKFPILGDIPILGYLFRSTSESTERTTLQFHITPRIVQGPRGFQEGASGG